MSKTLHLLVAPADVGNAELVFALAPVAGVAGLSSADRRLHLDFNLKESDVVAGQVGRMTQRANLSSVFTAQGLPPVDPFRLCYPQIKPACRGFVDLLARLDNLRESEPFSAIVHVGPDDWRRAIVEAFCAARDVGFHWQKSATSRRTRGEERARLLRGAMWILRDRRHNRRLQKGDAQTEFLFFAGLTRMMLGLAPVIQELRAQNAPLRVVDMYNDRIEALAGALPGGAWRLNGDAALFPASHRGNRALRRKIEALPDAPAQDAVTWRDFQLGAAAKIVLRDATATAVSLAQAVNAILKANPNALVIGTNENEQVLEIARAAERTVAVVQTSALAEYNRILTGRGRYLVMSDTDADGLHHLGVARDQIVACGHAYYDSLARRDARAEAEALRARLNIAAGRPLFLLLDVYAVPAAIEKETREDIFCAIYRGLAKAIVESGAILVIKLRPGQSVRGQSSSEDEHVAWAREAGIPDAQILVSREALVFPFIAACDLMISCDSTAGIEAILLDKPMISWPLSNADYFGYAAQGAAALAQNEHEVEAASLAFLREPQALESLARGRDRYRAAYFHAYDGNVAARQATALREARPKSTPE